MRKHITLLLIGLASALVAAAQDDFPLQFAYSDGTVIPDGTTLQLSDIEEDDFGDIQVPSRLYVKNLAADGVQGGATYVIQSITDGTFQTCFPLNCAQQRLPGEYTTGNEYIAPGELRNMQTEWLPDAEEGSAVVTYQLLTFRQNVITKKWIKDKEGPMITLRFSCGTADGIGEVGSEKPGVTSESYTDMMGRTVPRLHQGLCIKRTVLSNGTVVIKKHLAK